VIALGRAAHRRKTGRLGLAAAALSALECAPGLLLTGFVAPDRGTERAGRLFGLINRLDGVKMFALAALAVAGVALARTSWSLKAAT
jgi:hypothetical protein